MQQPPNVPADYALTGGLVFDGENFLSGHAVEIHGDMIHAVTREESLTGGIAKVSVQGAVIAPGFVDLQLNGCGGVMLNDVIEPSTLDTMHATNLKSGCTSFLPTLISTSEDDMRKTMSMVERYRAEKGKDSIIGLHLEGPYISKKRKGIHNEAAIRALSPDMRDAMADFAQRTPLMLTLAPECVDVEDVKKLADAGVVVSLGHSAASYEEAKRAVKAGARCATHLFNAMPPWQGRDPGVVGAVFDSPSLSCGMIVDGHHAHYASLNLARKIKHEMCFLVTDATAPVGTDMTQFSLCGQTVYVRDGMCMNADGTLGGSALTMIDAVGNSINHMGWAPGETLRMAALYPARLMSRDAHLGRIAPSCRANLAIFSPFTFAMSATVDKGKLHVWAEEKKTGRILNRGYSDKRGELVHGRVCL